MHLMLNIFQRKMFSCAKMHLMPKCCVFCFAKNKDAALTFCLQNVRKRQNAFDAKMHFCNAYIFLWKMFSCAKMHLMQKCIFAQLNIFQRKMFSITFSKGKCSASHFPKENVQLCKNAFDAKMLCFLLCKKQRCCPYILFTKC